MADLTAIILTYNEEKNITECLKSIKDICKRIIVIDSFSTDKTVDICSNYGCEIIQHTFTSHSEQFNYALNICNIQTKWVMRIDADERLTTESSKEIEQKCLEFSDSNINGLVLRFKFFFLGKYLKHGGYYPTYKLCVFKYGLAHIEKKEMDEHLVLDFGKSFICKKDSLHHNCKSINEWVTKHNIYSNKEVNDYLNSLVANRDTENLDKNAKKKQHIKHNFYYKLPMGFRAHLLFAYRYYLRFGFLDGKAGKYYAFLQAYWYRYLVDIKIYENKTESLSK